VQIPLLVLTSGIPNDAIATFVQQLLASQSSLADGVAAHKVLRLPESTSASFPEVLSQGLQWLASEAPSLPALMVCTPNSCPISDVRSSWRPDRLVLRLQGILQQTLELMLSVCTWLA